MRWKEFFFGKRQEGPERLLAIAVSPTEWRAIHRNAAENPGTVKHYSSSRQTGTRRRVSGEPLEVQLTNAIAGLKSEGVLGETHQIALLLVEEEVESVDARRFLDKRKYTSEKYKDELHNYGNLLNASEHCAMALCYSREPEARGQGDHAQLKLHTFIDETRIQRLTALLDDDDARKIKLIAPPNWPVAHHFLSLRKPAPRLYIQLGAHHSFIHLFDTTRSGGDGSGVCISRRERFGFQRLAESLARKNNISVDQGTKLLVDPNAEVTAGDSTLASEYAIALAPEFAEFIERIHEIIYHAHTDQGLGWPEEIFICGEKEKILGFTEWLEKELQLPGSVAFPPLKDDLTQTFLEKCVTNEKFYHGGAWNNLMSSYQDHLIMTAGKVHLDFVDGKIQRRTEPPQRGVSHVPIHSSAQHQPEKPASSPSPRNKSGGGGGTQQGSMIPDVGSFFAKLKGQLFPKHSATLHTEGGEEKEIPWIIVMSALIILFPVTLANKLSVAINPTGFDKATTTYHQWLDAHRGGVVGEEAARRSEAWTRRFEVVADTIPPKLWLHTITASESLKVIDAEKERRHATLLLKGAAHPSKDGHIADVSRYLAALGRDEALTDIYSQIRFAGAQVVSAYGEEVVDFTIEAVSKKGTTVTVNPRKGPRAATLQQGLNN